MAEHFRSVRIRVIPALILAFCLIAPALMLISAPARGLAQSNGSDFPDMPDKPTPQEMTFHDCPPEGEQTDPSRPFDPDLNKQKNRVDRPDHPFTVTLEQILALPRVKEAEWTTNHPVLRADWSNDTKAAIGRYEGIPVTVEGFFAGVREEGKESCNCDKAQSNRVDWHCWLIKSPPAQIAPASHGHGVLTKGDERRQAVVCETTPRVREKHPNWNLHQFEQIALQKQRIRLTGWIMFDPAHPDELPAETNDPTRGTLWEVHPITKIEVDQAGTWRDLDQ